MMMMIIMMIMMIIIMMIMYNIVKNQTAVIVIKSRGTRLVRAFNAYEENTKFVYKLV
jgi:competence protein ComGC